MWDVGKTTRQFKVFCIKKDDQKYTSKAGYHTKQSVPYFSKWTLSVIMYTFMTIINLKVQYWVASGLRLQIATNKNASSLEPFVHVGLQ